MSSSTTSSPAATDPSTTTSYRFGPLVWRSSKERRRAKHHRRDKCNSGDSGIQIELDHDDAAVGQSKTTDEAIPSASAGYTVNVRRANSAKAHHGSATAAARSKVAARKQQISTTGRHHTGRRSLSQATGLDALSIGANNSDSDDSADDSDDDDDNRNSDPIFAEVLYTFVPAGLQELALEKGALVEVVKRDAGPWWWGRLKLDEIMLSDPNEKYEGWFPKDFVQIIPAFPRPVKELQVPNAVSTIPSDLLAGGGGDELVVVEAKNCDITFPPAFRPENEYPANRLATSPPSTTACGPAQSSSTIRENVIKELMETEVNYVKLLSSLCVG